MDVTAAGPFNRVACPNCRAEVRVKVDLGNYLLQKRLAFGGMSVLFVALDQTLGREVALKVLNEEYSSDEVRTAQFEKEAELTALVSHPNVVRVYSVGRAFERFYIAMELIAGDSLEKRLEKGKSIPEREVLEIALQVTAGLKAAKASGLIHRDIKPGNILVDTDGTAKIVDFGLSLVTQAGSAQAEEIFATPYYAPPEALEAGVEDFRSDIYALGASLYHALAGVPPIDSTSTNTKVLLEAKLQAPPLKSVAPLVSQSTSDLVEKMMSFQKESRLASYDDVTDGLQRALEGQPQNWKLASRAAAGSGKSLSLAWVAGLIVLALVGLGVFVLNGRRNDPAEEQPPTRPVAAIEAAPSAEMKITKLYQQARAALTAGQFDEAELNFLRLNRLADVPEPTGLWAGFEGALCALLDGRAGDARDVFQKMGPQISSSNLDAETQAALVELFQKMPSLPAFEMPPECPAKPEMALMAFAQMLKNWEQGERNLQPFLDSFVTHEFARGQEWLQVYQDWARRIGEDLALLEEGEPEWERPWTEEEIENELARLETLSEGLQTSGRARFAIQSWQNWLVGLRAQQREPTWERDEK